MKKMSMKNGWIKLYRREEEWLNELTSQEEVYYMRSRTMAVWDKRNVKFGTFDARTKIVKEEMLPNWSMGKINTVKNSLLKKGYYKKEKDHRLKLTNAEIFLEKTKKYEIIFQQPGINLHITERNVREYEKAKSSIMDDVEDLTKHMTRFQRKDSEY